MNTVWILEYRVYDNSPWCPLGAFACEEEASKAMYYKVITSRFRFGYRVVPVQFYNTLADALRMNHEINETEVSQNADTRKLG
jgi:hypothetical protein